MAKLTAHAKERLTERFNIQPAELGHIGVLINNKYELVSIDNEQEAREIEYEGVSIHAIIKDDMVITCYEKESYPDPLAGAVTNMHNQLENFRVENESLKQTAKNYKSKENTMNEILNTKERFMTIKDVAINMDINEITVRRAVKELFPDLIQNGKITKLTEAHVTAVKLRIEKNHPDKNVEVIRTDLEETLLIKQGYELLLGRELALSEENKSLKIQLDYEKSWYSVKRVKSLGLLPDLRVIDIWRPLKKWCIENDRQIRGIFDANYGQVKTYHSDAWKAVYDLDLAYREEE